MAVLHINFMSAALGRQVNFTAVIPSVDFDHIVSSISPVG